MPTVINNRYFATPFRLGQTSNRCQILTRCGLFEYPQPEMAEALRRLEPHGGRLLDREQVLNEFANGREKILEEWLESGLLRELAPSPRLADRIQVWMPDLPAIDLLRETLQRLLGVDRVRWCDSEEQLGSDMPLTFVFLEPYPFAGLAGLLKRPDLQQTVWQIGYRLDRFCFLDNPHLPWIGNPDHFSCRENLFRSGEKSMVRDGMGSLMEWLEQRGLDEFSAVRLETLEYAWIWSIAFHRLQQLIGVSEQGWSWDGVNQAITLNPAERQVLDHSIAHYEPVYHGFDRGE